MLSSIVASTAPLVLAALGILFTYRAGVLNIAGEGLMLSGAFAGVAVAGLTDSATASVLAAVLAGLLVSGLFGAGCLWLRADVFVVGIGINLLMSGITAFLLIRLYGVQGTYAPRPFPALATVDAGVPVLGGQSVLVVVALVLIPVAHVVLFHTKLGTRIRVAGEAPDALTAAGGSSARARWAAIGICGALCGLAGAQLAMSSVQLFGTDMTAGRGFIALAAVFLGAGSPTRTVIGAVVFGCAEAVSDQLQVKGLPSEPILMLPYLVTIGALVLIQLARRPRGRAAIAAAGRGLRVWRAGAVRRIGLR